MNEDLDGKGNIILNRKLIVAWRIAMLENFFRSCATCSGVDFPDT